MLKLAVQRCGIGGRRSLTIRAPSLWRGDLSLRSASAGFQQAATQKAAPTCRRSPLVAAAATPAATAPGPTTSSGATMPTERLPGEWESPITSELITSAVRHILQ